MIPPHDVSGPTRAPVLVLSNSLGAGSAMWDLQMPQLRARFRVVRYEQRGHGGSPTPAPGPYSLDDLGTDLVDLLDHLGVERASLCGLSLGGMVALWVAAHHPGRVDRLVLACTSAELGPAGRWRDRAALVRSASTVSILRDELLERWFTPGFIAGRPALAGQMAAMLESVDAEGYAGCCEAIGSMDQRSQLPAVRAATLVISGSDDPVTPPAMGLELQEAIPGAALVVLPGASHLANIEQPSAFTAAVVDHLAGHVADRGEKMRRRVLGDAHVDRSASGASHLSAPFTDYITRNAWGDIWTRPTLDLRTRSFITVALLAGLGRLEELGLHVTGARRNGLTDEEIVETILHTAVYAGVPAANAALRVARPILESDG